MKIKILLGLALVMGMISCTKEKGTEIIRVRGMLVDKNSNAPAPNIDVFIVEVGAKLQRPNFLTQTEDEEIIRKGTTTDANGYFDLGLIEIKKSNDYQYDVRNYGLYLNTRINKGMDNYIFFSFEGTASLQVNLNPLPPYPAGDSLLIRFSNSPVVPIYYYGLTDENYMHQYYKRKYSFFTGNLYIFIDKYKSGIFTSESDTLHLKNGEFYQYDVNF